MPQCPRRRALRSDIPQLGRTLCWDGPRRRNQWVYCCDGNCNVKDTGVRMGVESSTFTNGSLSIRAAIS